MRAKLSRNLGNRLLAAKLSFLKLRGCARFAELWADVPISRQSVNMGAGSVAITSFPSDARGI